jgi:signal transduction histidine kinase
VWAFCFDGDQAGFAGRTLFFRPMSPACRPLLVAKFEWPCYADKLCIARRRADLTLAAETPGTEANIPFLLVDHDDKRVDRIEHFLHELFNGACRVDTTDSGEQALLMLRTMEYHVILARQDLPGLSGVQTFQKARSVHPDSVRILFNDSLEKDILIDAINTGRVFRVVSEPWDGAELAQCIKNGLDWRRSGRSMRILLAEQRDVQRGLLDSLSALEQTQRQMVHMERLATVGRLTGGVIHEVRNQLTGLMGVFSTLRMGDDTVAVLAQKGHRLVKNLTQQLASIEAFARAGGWAYEMRTMSLGSVLDEVVALHDLECGKPGMLLAAKPTVRCHDVRVDSGKIAHAMLAVIKDGHERFRSSVRLRAEVSKSGAVELTFAMGSQKVEDEADIAVSLMQDKAPFRAVVDMIVEAHGGTLALMEEPEGKTYARIVLPKSTGLE